MAVYCNFTQKSLKKWTFWAKKWRFILIFCKWRFNQEWRFIGADTIVENVNQYNRNIWQASHWWYGGNYKPTLEVFQNESLVLLTSSQY